MILLWLFLVCISSLHAEAEFVIVTASYNNERFCIRHLESLASQTYPRWSLIYINDCSEDRTGLLVEEFVRTHNLKERCTVIHNSHRKGAMANIYKAIHTIAPAKIVVCVDGDDCLSAPDVLEKLASIYRDDRVWVTYGNYTATPVSRKSICRPFPDEVLKKGSFRSHTWVSSHPKTFYAALFHKIAKKDLMYKGKFVSVASDLAFMFPILEMAREGHIRFISDILYLYNFENPLNDQLQKQKEVAEVEKELRARKPYKAVRSK